MPVTVQKILMHSTEVIKSCILPIGQLPEESQEAQNKDCRRFREHHTRKKSRIAKEAIANCNLSDESFNASNDESSENSSVECSEIQMMSFLITEYNFCCIILCILVF